MSGLNGNYMRPDESLNGWQALANAIVIQAAKDYIALRHVLREAPNNSKANKMIADIKAFFCSRWYAQLTDLDPEFLLRKLREEAAK